MSGAIERNAAWHRIETEARAQAAAEVQALTHAALVFGQYIAWATYRYGRTDGITAVHRVGFPIGHKPYTTCGEIIPSPVCWVPLTPRLVEVMPQCRFCEAEYIRLENKNAA